MFSDSLPGNVPGSAAALPATGSIHSRMRFPLPGAGSIFRIMDAISSSSIRSKAREMSYSSAIRFILCCYVPESPGRGIPGSSVSAV